MDRKTLIQNMWDADEESYLRFLNNEKNKEYNLAKYFFHTHTDYGSPKDAILTVKDYVKKAKEMGAKAISITDHGTMYAVHPLYQECKKNDIKLIIGVEFYVCDTVEDKGRKKHTRLHLCGYAKNKEGYLALSRLITESNERIIIIHTQDGDLTYPCISKKLLEQYIGPGSDGHGNVFLTSACIGGVLTGISMANETVRLNIEDLEKKTKMQKEALDKLKFAERAMEKAEKEKAELTLIANKIYTKRKQALKRNPDPLEEQKILQEEEESRKAALRIKEINAVIKQAKHMKSENQKVIDTATKIKYCEIETADRFIKNAEQELMQLQSELVPENYLVSKFSEEALWYDHLAGHGNWYIELQYHGLPAEKRFMPHLVRIAKEHDIPLLAANDAHMADKEDAIIRKYVNALRFNKWEGLEVGDEEMYLKDDVSLFHSLAGCVGSEAAWNAMKNREMVAFLCNVDLKKEAHYPMYIDC
ncbi:MAG: PHP domain-containing protein [Lachnospiraceae bacterium]|nr:PHP domain-containing protein [Lachnospiraceae bacterium]